MRWCTRYASKYCLNIVSSLKPGPVNFRREFKRLRDKVVTTYFHTRVQIDFTNRLNL